MTAWLTVNADQLAPRTLERYGEALDRFLAFLRKKHGDDPPVTVLSRSTMEEFRGWLGRAGGARHGRTRSASTVQKYCEAVELCWVWGEDSERWPDVPRPRRLKFRGGRRPQPVAATFDEFDAMLVELAKTVQRYGRRVDEGVARDWPLRTALLARYTGARRSAILQLGWDDLDLDRGALVLPNEITKGQYGGRTVPVHPALAAEVEGWEPIGERIVAAPELELTGRGHVDRTLRRAWARAEVREAVWRGQPLHVSRKMIRSSMVGAGVQPDVVDAYLGHAGAGTGGRSYTDRTFLWEPMVAAVAAIPRHPSMNPSMESRIARAHARGQS